MTRTSPCVLLEADLAQCFDKQQFKINVCEEKVKG